MKNMRQSILHYLEVNGPHTTQEIWLGLGGREAEKNRVYQTTSLMYRAGAIKRDAIRRYSVVAPTAPVTPLSTAHDDLFPSIPMEAVDLTAIRDAASPIISLLDDGQPSIVNKVPQHGLICVWLAVSDLEALRDALQAS